MSIRRLALASAAALAFALPVAAQAASVIVVPDQWVEFNVDGTLYSDLSLHDYNSDIDEGASFEFTVATGYQASLTVVDMGYAGDRFTLLDNGLSLGATGATTPNTTLDGDAVLSADDALADASFSRRVYTLAAGSHAITGLLSTSLLNMNSTNGALKVTVSAVPEPATVASLLAGLALLGAVARRRAAR